MVLGNAPRPRLEAQGCEVELRLDSPDGPVIGKSEFLEPKDELSFDVTQLTIPVQLPTDFDWGLHDVYLTFVNEEVESGSLMLFIGTQVVLNTAE